LSKREFTVANEYHYNRTSPTRWIISHLLRHKYAAFGFMILSLSSNALFSSISVETGRAFNAVLLGEAGRAQLVTIALTLLVIVILAGTTDLGARLLSEITGKRFARDAREELYISLLGKSQTFHHCSLPPYF
jgi:ATP-binding cassette subfamily B protein